MSDDIDENRIIDEAVKHITKDKVRIEDLKKLSEDDNEMMNELARYVLNAIIAMTKKQNDWAIKNGAEIPNPIKINFILQHMVLVFIEVLVDKWLYASTHALSKDNLANFKDMLDRKK